MKCGALILTVFFITAGCNITGSGRKFDTSYPDQIQAQKTTKQDVLTHLGKPQTVNKSSGNSEIWIYNYRQGKNAFNIVDTYGCGWGLKTCDHPSDLLIIYFEGDLVQRYQLSQTGQ